MQSRILIGEFKPGVTVDFNDESLFNYTSGRWIYNERFQMSRRYLRFDANALGEFAAKACGATRCVELRKLQEGSSNKVLLLAFDNGDEVIARLPFPMAGPPHLLTASEVATMEFIRTVLSVPVPRVLSWSSRAESTPVGAEFILMEKIPGVDLRGVIKDALKANDLHKIMLSLNAIEQKFTRTPFAKYGSIYFKEDLAGLQASSRILRDKSNETDVSRNFAIGPHMGWELWHGERREMDVYRGPWDTAEEFLTGFIRCEQEWLRRFAKPRHSTDPFYRSDEDNDPSVHVCLLDYCLESLLRSLPSRDLCSPVLWHPDLHRSNIFVTDRAPYSLTGLIDWQYTGISPFFTQMLLPKAFTCEGGRVDFKPESRHQPLPDNYAELSEEEKALTRDDQFDAAMRMLYEYIMKGNPFQHIFHTNPEASVFMGPYHTYPGTWVEGLAKMKFMLAQLQYSWQDVALPGTKCPYNIPAEDIEGIVSEVRRVSKYDEKVEDVRSKLGLQADGWVPNELYEATMKRNEEFRATWNDEESGGPYPFQNGAPSDGT